MTWKAWSDAAMWPFRPSDISTVLSDDDIRALLLLGGDLTVSFVEALPDDELRTVDADPRREERSPDPFCSFFRHGKAEGGPAFSGADEACAACERKFARRGLSERAPASAPLQRRCHMGLTDFQVPVEYGGRRLGSLIAGRVVKTDEERGRIRKIVERLGTLTRAERDSSGEAEPVRPASEKARKRLLQEVDEIPLASDRLGEVLGDLSRRFEETMARQIGGLRSRWESELLALAEEWPQHAPASFADLSRQTAGVLELLRGRLGLEFLAFFARTPRELDGPELSPSLIAESGLSLNVRRRLLELEWSRSLPRASEDEDAVSRGRDAVSAFIGLLRPTDEAPEGLKDRLAKSVYLAAVEPQRGREAALAFGPPRAESLADGDDYRFLVRLTRATVRRYYALASEVERIHLRERLQKFEGRIDRYQETVADLKAAEREARLTRGYTNFDAAKLILSCVDGMRERAGERGVEIEARSLPDHLPLHAHRGALRDALRALIGIGIERSSPAREGATASPLRVFVKRRKEGLRIVVEAIGDHVGQEERRRWLNSREGKRPKGLAPGKTVPEKTQSGAHNGHRDPDFAPVFRGARRHRGRFRLDTQRLHRREDSPGLWVGKLSMALDLPADLERVKKPR